MNTRIRSLPFLFFLLFGLYIEGYSTEENTIDDNQTLYINMVMDPSEGSGLLTNLTSNLAFRYCNRYCNGASQEHIFPSTCLIDNPRCKACQCDTSCHKYGDCCPDVDGKLNTVGTKYYCVGSKENEYMISGYFMATACSGEPSVNPIDLTVDDIHPVTSQTTNITYINSHIAACNGDTNFIVWNKETTCDVNSGNEAFPSDVCVVNIYPDSNLPVHMCDPVFSNNKFIDTCNNTGLWNGSRLNTEVDLEVECSRFPLYPVSKGQLVFKNIYCFLCNGQQPLMDTCTRVFEISINTLVTLTDEGKPVCSSFDWYDELKNRCRPLKCRTGFELKGDNCEMMNVNLTAIIFFFRGDFWPVNPGENPGSWSEVESLVVQNLPNIMTNIKASDYVFSVYNYEKENTSDLTPTFGLDVEFRTNKNCCRLEYEDSITEVFNLIWTLNDSHSTYDYEIWSSDDLDLYEDERETYKVVFPSVDPVKTNPYTYLSDIVDLPKVYIDVTVPITLPDCSFVYLRYDDFKWNNYDNITLGYADIVISTDNFTVIDVHELAICVSTLEYLYSKIQPPIDLLRRAENIVSLMCSIVSLVCLTLTFITYCTFTSLLTLPTKNTICLVVSLFIAQLLLQFGGVAKQTDVACKTIGVLLHYSWLCVIFWMNVCSFHMFHVFVIDAGKAITQRGHNKRLFRYFMYANGTPAIIVLATITASLVVSSGRQIGYGDGPCYLSTALLTGVSFVLPLGVILVLNIIFFGMSVRTMAKISKMSDRLGKDRNHVHIYIKLSTLTGVFWVFSILAENLRIEVLIFISIVLNASQGVFIFLSYVANKRVLKMWGGKFGVQVSRQTSTNTVSTQL